MRKGPVAQRLAVVKDRLREPIWWFPIPVFLSYALVLLLTAHALSDANPRMGNPADVITFPSEQRKDSALWVSVTPIGDEIVVTTGDRHVFRWNQHVQSLAELQSFVEYLKGRSTREIESAALMKHAFSTQTTLVIAADQRLKFLHIRPILHALAAAGISRYAFETQNPLAVAAPHEGAGEASETHAE